MHEPWVDWEDYEFYVDRLADWMEMLEWALVPLEYEGAFVMVVASHDRATVIRRIELELAAKGHPAFHIQRKSDAT